MKCLVCGGRMEEKRVTLARIYEEQPGTPYAIITDVPASVCKQCGEKVYTPEVVEKLQTIRRLVRKGARPKQTVEVPVYSLTDSE